MSVEVHDWTVIQENQKLKIFFKLWRFSLWALYTSIGCMMLGFDFGIAGTLTAFPAFQKEMGIPWPSEPSGYLIPANYQSAWSAMSTVGDIIGVAIAGQLMDLIGRKHNLAAGCVFTSVGIFMQIFSHEWKLFLGGRLINAIGFGMVLVLAPVWIGETVRPELRGCFLCIQNCSIVFAQFILALASYGTSFMTGKWSYQIIVILQFMFIIVLALGYPFFPESPYYLIMKDRDDDTVRKSLRRIHGSTDPGLIEAELIRIKTNFAASQELNRLAGTDGHPLFQIFKPRHLKRTFIAFLGPASQQLIGAAFVLGYITYFLGLLGITNNFEVSVALYCVMLASNLAAFPLIEVVGRRTLLLYGILALTFTELIMGICAVVNNAASNWVIIVCIFLWALFYQVSVGAVGFAVTAEVPNLALRPITISAAAVVQGFFGWLIGFISPYMINPDAGNLQGKVGFVFFSFGVPLCILFFFFIPETKNLSFDEIDDLFNDKVSPRHFKREALRRRALRSTNIETAEDGTKTVNVTQVERIGDDNSA